MNDENDELTGIFDNLTVADFESKVVTKGAAAFAQFVTAYIETTRWAYKVSDGNMLNPVVVLTDGDETWGYLPTDTETLGEFVDRLGVEAKAKGATWFFLARKTLVGGMLLDPDKVVDISDPSQLQTAIENGQVANGVYFYAERREPGEEPDIRHGIIRTTTGHELGEPIMSDPRQGSDFYAGVLGEKVQEDGA